MLMCPKNVATLLPIHCGQIVTVAANATVIVIATVGILSMARDARCAAAHRQAEHGHNLTYATT